MKLGFKTAPQRTDWATLEGIWRLAGELDAFDSAWTFDHLYPVDGDGAQFEGWTTLALLAHHVPGMQVGHLVLANPYRHPGLVAKMATVMDHATGGRFVLGLGAGWHEVEMTAYGIPFELIGPRMAGLEAALRVIRALFSDPAGRWPDPGDGPSAETGGATLDAPPFRLLHARNDPLPLTPGGPPIWIGTMGERVGMRLVATYADGWNFGSGPVEMFTAKLDALRRACDAAGRDLATIEISAQLRVTPTTEGRAEALAYGRAIAEAGCQHLVLYLDPRDGPAELEAIAREVAAPLRSELGR